MAAFESVQLATLAPNLSQKSAFSKSITQLHFESTHKKNSHKLIFFLSFQEKMEEMQQHNMSWIEVQFLKKAVDILCECRRTLMYTYVFAYYLKKNNESEIFEVNIETQLATLNVF